MRIIIMGCGRVGSQVSRLLEAESHIVTVIDYDGQARNRLGPDFKGRVVPGAGVERRVFIEAGIEQADAFAAATPSDNINIIAARIARNVFNVPRVVARVYDPRRAEIYRRLGLVTISSTVWGAERIRELLTYPELDAVHVFGNGEVSLITLETPPLLNGRTLNIVAIPGEIMPVAVTRDGKAFVPTLGTVLRAGDILHLAVLSAAMGRLETMLGLNEGG